MAGKKVSHVTMRVRIGENELEVSGPSDYVEKKIEEFVKLNKEKPFVSKVHSGTTVTGISQKTQESMKKMSAAQFFNKFTPQTSVDRVLSAGYYLEKFQNNESFTANDIRETIRNAKRNPPTNTNDAINSNIKKGLIMSAGDKEGIRAFVLTSDGEVAINELIV